MGSSSVTVAAADGAASAGVVDKDVVDSMLLQQLLLALEMGDVEDMCVAAMTGKDSDVATGGAAAASMHTDFDSSLSMKNHPSSVADSIAGSLSERHMAMEDRRQHRKNSRHLSSRHSPESSAACASKTGRTTMMTAADVDEVFWRVMAKSKGRQRHRHRHRLDHFRSMMEELKSSWHLCLPFFPNVRYYDSTRPRNSGQCESNGEVWLEVGSEKDVWELRFIQH